MASALYVLALQTADNMPIVLTCSDGATLVPLATPPFDTGVDGGMGRVGARSVSDVIVGGEFQLGARRSFHYDGAAWTVKNGPDHVGRVLHYAADGFAVGSGVEGKVIHLDAGTWTEHAPPADIGGYEDAHGPNSSDVWIIGSWGGAIWHWNGAAWSISQAFDALKSSPRGVWGYDANFAIVVGSGTDLYKFNGAAWAAEAAPTNPLNCVWGTSPTDIWVGGDNGYLAHWNGAVWIVVAPAPTSRHIAQIVGIATDDIWAVANNWRSGSPITSALLHYDGASWSVVDDGLGAGAYYSFRGAAIAEGPDVDPPYLASPSPAALTSGVSRAANIAFSVLDDGSGLDAATVVIRINGTIAWSGGAQQNGFTVATAVVVDGVRYTVTPPANLNSYSTCSVRVVADDAEGNQLDTTYTFQVEDYLGPLVTPVAPVAGATGRRTDTTIALTVTDETVILPGWTVEIDRGDGWEMAYENGGSPAFKAGFNGPQSAVVANAPTAAPAGQSPIGASYTVTIDPLSELPHSASIQVRVTAADPALNATRT